jgi:DNA-directed RNA polymerase specialized sigma24 family protein
MSTELEDSLEKQDWKEIVRRLTLYAKGRLGRGSSIHDAEEIAQEAIRIVLDPEYRQWDPETDLLYHLQSNVNGLISNRWKTKSRSQERLRDFTVEQGIPDPSAGVVDRIEASETLEKLLEHAISVGDELCQKIILEAVDGIVAPQEVAAKLGVKVGQVYEARRKLKKYIDTVLPKKEE